MCKGFLKSCCMEPRCRLANWTGTVTLSMANKWWVQ